MELVDDCYYKLFGKIEKAGDDIDDSLIGGMQFINFEMKVIRKKQVVLLLMLI